MAVLQNALAALEKECAATGKDDVFREVRGQLSDGMDDLGYAEIGKRLGMTEGAVRVAMHRLRRRYGELLRAEVAQTVGTASEVEEEWLHLIQVLRE